jgi:predicted phosphodiesterase
MRVAALYDIHGNMGALDAVLADLRHERVDAVVIGGDVAWGPFPGETIDRLMELGATARFVRGNTDREIVAAFDAGARFDPAADSEESLAAWCGERLTQRQRDFLAGFEPTVILDVPGLGRTLFCHATPTSDEEIFTSLTPDAEVEALLGDIDAAVVVCGHTHVQSERRIGATRVVKAGSVGVPYAAEPGAYWALLGPDVSFRHTRYDLGAVAAAVRASGFPRPGFVEENILAVEPAGEAERRLEQMRLERRRA